MNRRARDGRLPSPPHAISGHRAAILDRGGRHLVVCLPSIFEHAFWVPSRRGGRWAPRNPLWRPPVGVGERGDLHFRWSAMRGRHRRIQDGGQVVSDISRSKMTAILVSVNRFPFVTHDFQSREFRSWRGPPYWNGLTSGHVTSSQAVPTGILVSRLPVT